MRCLSANNNNNFLNGAVDTAKSVMESAIHALLILLDYGHPIRCTDEEAVDPAIRIHRRHGGAGFQRVPSLPR